MHQRGPASSGSYVPRCVPQTDVTWVPFVTTFSAMSSAVRKLGQPCSSVSAWKSARLRFWGAAKSGRPQT